jgi:peptidoglycan/xylan/chitin deacetylase (PgdA/CDA1 family)
MSRRVPGFRRLRQVGRWLRSQRQAGVVILGYHQVREVSTDPFNLAVTPAELDEHLGCLARTARPVTLHQAADEVARGTAPRRTVVVTFDDGYDDTLTTALPLLRKHRVPATVFIATGNAGEPFWWDALAGGVFGAGRLPDRIALDVSGRRHVYTTLDRVQLARQLAALLRPIDAEKRTPIMSSFLEQTGVLNRTTVPRALRGEEIEQLASDSMVEIGAHSVTHPLLATLAADKQQTEITESRTMLETLTGRPLRSFSYPHGSFDLVTRRLVIEAGFTVACGSEPDVATRASDPLALPRFWVDGDRKRDFSRWFNRWLS